jgi:TolB-like protein/DNA-binding winged helix-turn-helix (wHTH) protein/Tfp pilus assembly protein PilF
MTTEPSARARTVRFGTFEADLGTRELRKGGMRIKLQGQPFEVLAMLLERPGEVVPREELQQRLWPTDTFVDFDHGVNTAINRLREALGDSAENPRFVETLPRRGYRFIAPLEPQVGVPITSGVPTGSSLPESNAVETETGSRVSGRRARAAIAALVAAIVLIAGLSLSSVRERIFGRGAPRIQSLAVLPLANLSSDTNQDFFADGMTEALTTDLGKISALRVISRTSAMQYKGTKKTLPEIAKELNVDALVEGTVARSGNHLRITANLVQADPEKHLWADSYESEVGDILTVQGEVAQAVAREIQVKLTPEEKKLLGSTRPVNPKAHDDYLKGHYLCDADTREGLDKGIQLLQEATQEDPNDPLAFAGLADCYALWAWAGDLFAGDLSPKDVMEQARNAATKSLQLDESLVEAHTARANVALILDWNWSDAEREFKRAIELNPNSSQAHMWYAHYLVAMSRFDESSAEARRAMELDPYSEYVRDFSCWASYLARRYDAALQQSEKSIELFPQAAWPRYHIGIIYEQTGRASEAIPEFMTAEERFGISAESLAELRKVYQVSREKGYWRKYLSLCEEASSHPRKFANSAGYGFCDYMQDADIAAMQVRLGEFNAAFGSLEKGLANHGNGLIYLNVDPFWDKIRSDVRFHELVRRVGLPQ